MGRAWIVVAIGAVAACNLAAPTTPPDQVPTNEAPTGNTTFESTPPPAATFPRGQTSPACGADADRWSNGVHVSLALGTQAPSIVSFGLPVPRGVLGDAAHLSIKTGGASVPANVDVLLRRYDATGQPIGVAAVLVQLKSTDLGTQAGVDVSWEGSGSTMGRAAKYAETSVAADATAEIARRTIAEVSGQPALVEQSRESTLLYSAREPATVASFPDGYLAASGILGCQVASSELGADMGGIGFISTQAVPFALSAMYAEDYAVNPDSVYTLDPEGDASTIYEGWLYDRCATFLAIYAHTNDPRFEREGFHECAHYVDQIATTSDLRGIFTGKPEPDAKYSHVRGILAYYALTGDEAALEAGRAVADLWLNDQEFVGPYRAGHLRGPDKLWTERLLAHSIEGLYYGHVLTGEVRYLDAARELVNTAYTHISGDAATLAALNPGTPAFPPQNCFIHTAEQAAEGDAQDPFCSGWMPALLVDPLTAYGAQTGDGHVDEIFIRLTRFLRDTGTSYFTADPIDDTFMHPTVAYDPDSDDPRRLMPLYGAGVQVDGTRLNMGEFDDTEHCLDASAIVAAGMRGLKHIGGYDTNAVGPFASEGESFRLLFEELAACAELTFTFQTRPHRDPATWTADELAEGVSDPATFIRENKIGWPFHNVSPRRKLSWWFNPALEVFGLLADGGVDMPELHPGAIAP